MNIIRLLALSLIALLCSCTQSKHEITSPDKDIKLCFYINDNGVPYYYVIFKNDTVIKPSLLGVKFINNRMDTLLSLESVEINKGVIPYDFTKEELFTHNSEYNSIDALVAKGSQKLNINMRVYNDGVAIRYFAYGFENTVLVGDMTEVNFNTQKHTMWAMNENTYNNYIGDTTKTAIPAEHLIYNDDSTACNTSYIKMPVIINNDNGNFMSLHVFSLEEEDEFWLRKCENRKTIFTSMINKGEKERIITLPSYSPWVVLSISDSPEKLLESSLDYNLRLEEEDPILSRDYPLNIYKTVAFGNILKLDKIKRSTMAHDLALAVIFNKEVNLYDGNDEIFNIMPIVLRRKNTDIAENFVNSIPYNWGLMKTIDAEFDEYIIAARKDMHSDNWFVGGVTNNDTRKGSFTLDFLNEGFTYEATIYSDDLNSNKDVDPDALSTKKLKVKSTDTIPYEMLSNGGFTVTLKQL